MEAWEAASWLEQAAPLAGLAYLARHRRAAPRAARIGAAGLGLLVVLRAVTLANGYLLPNAGLSVGALLQRAGVVAGAFAVDYAVYQLVTLGGYLLLAWAVVADRRPTPAEGTD